MTMSAYSEFLRTHLKDGDSAMAVLYHAVRKIPYGSIGERDAVKVIANNLGSCSGKHILLRDLLRETGHEAEIITIFTYFNRGVPSHPAMPEDLRKMIEDENICDFHHYVHARRGDRWLKLDATWHDALSPYGFPVNRDWRGQGDTVLAATPVREYPAVEDLATWKMDLLEQLDPEQRDERARFFRRLSAWIATL
jgi:Transglutaminase-like superfamily